MGSISHSSGLVAAAVGWSSEFRAIGIDAEGACALEPEVVAYIATPEELGSAARVVPEDAAAALVFSAKEAVYKVWSPITGMWLNFGDVSLAFSIDGSFRARVHIDHKDVGETIFGRHRLVAGRVVTAIAMRR